MKVIVILRVRSASGIFHFHKIRLQFFINSSRAKVVFPFSSIPTKKYNFNIFVEKRESCRAHRYVLSEQKTKQNGT